MEVRKNYVIVDFLGFPLDTEQRAIGWEPQSEQPIDEGDSTQTSLHMNPAESESIGGFGSQNRVRVQHWRRARRLTSDVCVPSLPPPSPEPTPTL